MASEWNLLFWLECIGVVSGCCCKEVYRDASQQRMCAYPMKFQDIQLKSLP